MDNRVKKIYCLWLFVSLILSSAIIPFFWGPPQSSPLSLSLPSICHHIANLSITADTVLLHYRTRLPSFNLTVLSHHFALRTSWISQPIFFQPGSANTSILDDRTLSLQFYLPFISDYTGFLYCVPPHRNITKNWESLHPFVLKKLAVRFSIRDFLPSADYGQLRCAHSDNFPRRWCEFRNLLFADRTFYLTSPALFELPEPFIVPGPRAPPFDKDSDQFRSEPIIQTRPISDIHKSFNLITDFSYFYGVFHNYFMLWHTIFDFMLPLYHFITLFNGTDTPSTRRIYVRSDGVWGFQSLMRGLSAHPVTIVYDLREPTRFEKGVIGIEKLERNVDPKREYDASIGFHYDADRATGRGMREAVLRAVNISADVVGQDGRALVLLVDRGSGSRNLPNQNELHGLMSGSEVPRGDE